MNTLLGCWVSIAVTSPPAGGKTGEMNLGSRGEGAGAPGARA